MSPVFRGRLAAPHCLLCLFIFFGAGCAQGPDSSQETAHGADSSVGQRCRPDNLRASYLFDVGEDQGRLEITWNRIAPGYTPTIVVEVEGVPSEQATLAAGTSEFLSESRIQWSPSTRGEVDVYVRVEVLCEGGVAVSDEVFSFLDPVQECPVPSVDTLGQVDNVGEFYACADSWLAGGRGCGADGYPLGYGEYYALRFYNKTRPWMTWWGRYWLDDTLVCLQQDLQAAITMGTSCGDVRRIAFSQHANCYAENGACYLWPWDVAQVLRTVDGRDWISREGAQQIVGFFLECGEEYAELIDALHPGR